MARLDWDRLRRERPLEGADARVDPDGGVIWQRPFETPEPFGARRLRFGVIVRRRREQAASAPTEAQATTLTRCRRCGAMIATRRRLRHGVRCKGQGGPG